MKIRPLVTNLTLAALIFTLALSLFPTTARAAALITNITVTASSQDTPGGALAVNLVNNSGIDPCDPCQLHSNLPTDMWLANGTFGGNPRGGTVTGSHWVQFDLSQPYELDYLEIWNYNAPPSTKGINRATIQASLTGSTNPADWSTVYDSAIPQAAAYAAAPSPIDLTVDLNQINARYLVFTADDWPTHNYNPNQDGDVGLSEVRFYAWTSPATCAEALDRGYGYLTDFNHDCHVNLADFAVIADAWLWCIDPADETCLQPWPD